MKVAAELRIKHGDLYLACQQHGGVKAFATKLGVSYQTLCNWLRMKSCPATDRYPEIKTRLEELTGKTIAELFPPELREALPLFAKTSTHVLIKDMPVAALVAHSEATVARLTADDPAEIAEQHDLQTRMKLALSYLPDRERKIIEMRWGLLDGVPRTLEAVGKEFGLTKDRIRQIEAKAIRRLQLHSEALLGDFKPELPPRFDVLDAAYKQSQSTTLRDQHGGPTT